MQAEIDVLGIHHGELGGVIGRRWNLPERVANAMTYHHAPDQVADVVCDAVHVANVAARMIDVPPGAATDTTSPSAGALQRLGLKEPSLERVCRHVERRLSEVTARYTVASQSLD
jgi:HD-like signal output (HDOD) protein